MMRRKYFQLFLLFWVASHVFTPGIFAEDGRIFTGLGVEFNNHNTDGGAIGGGLMGGYVINSQFYAGLRVNFFQAANRSLSSFETLSFFRYNLPLFESVSWLHGLFVKAELGSVIYFYQDETFPAFSGGIAIGWRYDFNRSFFIEPAVRFGYPHIWGVGVTAGYTFPRRNHE